MFPLILLRQAKQAASDYESSLKTAEQARRTDQKIEIEVLRIASAIECKRPCLYHMDQHLLMVVILAIAKAGKELTTENIEDMCTALFLLMDAKHLTVKSSMAVLSKDPSRMETALWSTGAGVAGTVCLGLLCAPVIPVIGGAWIFAGMVSGAVACGGATVGTSIMAANSDKKRLGAIQGRLPSSDIIMLLLLMLSQPGNNGRRSKTISQPGLAFCTFCITYKLETNAKLDAQIKID